MMNNQVPELTPWFKLPAPVESAISTTTGAYFIRIPLASIHDVTKTFTHDMQKLISLIPSLGIADRKQLCAEAGIADSTLRGWLYKSPDFRNAFYTLGEVELEQLATFGQLRAVMEVPGVVERLIELSRQLKPVVDPKTGVVTWSKSSALYTAALRASERLLAMAGVDTVKSKEETKAGDTVQVILQTINNTLTGPRADVGGIAPPVVDSTLTYK